ncbi:hypothetical protein TSUD_369760 [Trifolium subterraneum]|uniref:Uncharacterized protein n=1 Tax=Trifolium subterraneum TaxID=3900 RepID=A0A2Z6MXR4_TRISU|nr:hypothetical protein TSUD_369760 [Trifolium subterraneum]
MVVVVVGERFGVELDNIIIGRDKIFVNLTRFQRREENHRVASEKNHKNYRELQENTKSYNDEAYVPKSDRNRYSYAAVVQNDKDFQGKVDIEKRANHSLKGTKHILFIVKQDEINILSKLYVGEVEHPDDCTMKKDSMDVARMVVREKSTKTHDEEDDDVESDDELEDAPMLRQHAGGDGEGNTRFCYGKKE